MQTFLPYADFERSAQCLDNKRLGKQRLEAYQIIRTLNGTTKGWAHHPAIKMWDGFENALKLYYNACLKEWIRRGFRNSMKLEEIIGDTEYPPWFGDERFHASHRSNLLRKDPEFYGRYGWMEGPGLPYYWPARTW